MSLKEHFWVREITSICNMVSMITENNFSHRRLFKKTITHLLWGKFKAVAPQASIVWKCINAFLSRMLKLFSATFFNLAALYAHTEARVAVGRSVFYFARLTFSWNARTTQVKNFYVHIKYTF